MPNDKAALRLLESAEVGFHWLIGGPGSRYSPLLWLARRAFDMPLFWWTAEEMDEDGADWTCEELLEDGWRYFRPITQEERRQYAPGATDAT